MFYFRYLLVYLLMSYCVSIIQDNHDPVGILLIAIIFSYYFQRRHRRQISESIGRGYSNIQ